MAGRQRKVGLDYFELDCQLEEKIRLIQAEFGLKGFAIVVKLYQKIYGEFGYYCEWNEDSLLLFMSENGVSSRDEKNLISEIVAACIRRNIFSEKIFVKYGVLTSVGVQKRYLRAVSKREEVELKKEYLLISVGENNKNIVVNSISDGNNSISDGRNAQRRVEKSREDIKTLCKADAVALFERLWKLYPVKKGKGKISDAKKMKLLEIGYDEMARAIERYTSYVKSIDYLQYQNGSTFFNSGYVDYLDANYTPDSQMKGKTNRFNQFPQNDYDFDALEKELLGN